MTLHHFLITAGYVFWAYIMMYILIKLIIDTSIIKKECKRDEYSAQFFLCKEPKKLSKRRISYLIRYTKNNIYFDTLCREYALNKKHFSPSQSKFFYDFIVRAIEHKIKITGSNDNLTKALLVKCILMCSVSSAKISRFLSKCKTGSVFEKEWIASFDKLNENIEEEKK